MKQMYNQRISLCAPLVRRLIRELILLVRGIRLVYTEPVGGREGLRAVLGCSVPTMVHTRFFDA